MHTDPKNAQLVFTGLDDTLAARLRTANEELRQML
jgi:hypothetical protein